jgi:CheY-like chemotaxis protein
LRAARILIVEDEALVAYALEQILVEYGYEVVGPAPNIGKALKLIADEPIDAALLDINLGNERSDGAAEALAAACIPFLFTTGYSRESAMPDGFKDRPCIGKPYQPEQLQQALAQLLTASADASALPTGTVRT